MPTIPITKIAVITLVMERLFHSFHTKYPMPVPPTSISAATMTSQAMPMEMRMPVRIVGAAAGRMMVKARLNVPTSSGLATFSHSRRTEGTPKAVLIMVGHSEQMKMTKIADRLESLMV